MVDKKSNQVKGVVLEALPGTSFQVELEDGSTIIAHLAGKMRLHRIRVIVGDSVLLELDEYGSIGRIVKRT